MAVATPPRTQPVASKLKMPTYRGNAIAVGVLFILCSAAAILSIVPLGAPVGAPSISPSWRRTATGWC